MTIIINCYTFNISILYFIFTIYQKYYFGYSFPISVVLLQHGSLSTHVTNQKLRCSGLLAQLVRVSAPNTPKLQVQSLVWAHGRINECINKRNNKLMFLSLKSINTNV